MLDKGEVKAGQTYVAGLRLHPDLTQMPKTFQVSALANKDWTRSSDWLRWSFTVGETGAPPQSVTATGSEGNEVPTIAAACSAASCSSCSPAAPTPLFASNYPLLDSTRSSRSLFALIVWQVRALWQEHRAKVFGSRLKLRLMLMFGLRRCCREC